MKKTSPRRISWNALLGSLFIILIHPFIQGGCGGGGGSSTPPPPPKVCDLRVISVDAPSGSYDPGDSFNVSNSTTNDGPDDCLGYTVTFYASTDTDISATADTQIANFSRGTLANGSTHNDNNMVWLPFTLADGAYYIGMIVSYANDPDTSNNKGYDSTPITVGGDPDLYDDGDTWNGFSPTTVAAGDSFSAWCDVRNGGTAAAGGFYVDFYASTNTIISTSDDLIGRVYVSGCNAGTYVNADLSIPSFPSIPNGTYYVGWIIDADNDVSESNEANNTAYEPGYQLVVNNIVGDPDLYDDGDVYNGFSPTVVEVEDSFSAWCRVRNGGTADAGGFYVDFYASTNMIISSASDYLIDRVYVPGCSAGNYVDVNLSVLFPASVPAGTYSYWVGWIIDADNDVSESNEANNTAYEPGYQLGVDDIYEHNNARWQAWDFSFGEGQLLSVFGGEFGRQYDDDWYKINVTAGFEAVHIDCPFTHADGNIDIQLVNSSGIVILTAAGTGDMESIFVNNVGPSGTYYIRVYGANAGNPYDLWWDDTAPAGPAAFVPFNTDEGGY